MGERVPVEDFLAEIDAQLADNMIGGGDPAYFDIEYAMYNQRREYVMRRMRKLLAGQKFVNLPDAVHKDREGIEYVYRREDYDDIEEG